MNRQNGTARSWPRLALFLALALLPVVGLALLLGASYARGPVVYLLVVVGALLILALPVGKLIFFPSTTLEHLYRGWIIRRIRNTSKS
jgi:fatty acid desaturase